MIQDSMIMTVWIGLLSIPTIVYFCFKRLKNDNVRLKIFLYSAAFSTFNIFLYCFSITWRGVMMDVLVLLSFYFTYSLIVYYVFLIPNIIIQRILTIPVLLPIVVGYFLSVPPGWLALAWTVSEYAPKKEIELNDQLTYREYWIDEVGTRITIFKTVSFLPLLERTLMDKTLSLDEPQMKLRNLKSDNSKLGIEIYSNNTLRFDTLINR